ncbi:hypothetical protein H5410_013575 [Solanum commersonii]|uniref:Uncharacterized protein n=1 Tax=Solanum commersonii TaxID=4109 RepID=A0A9J5ZNU5_SOLCO|nr:hypothetical protein H5410_013575 [Solanum commersonii]
MNQPNQQILRWPWEHIWKARIPHKVACFAWLLAKEVVLTQELDEKGDPFMFQMLFRWGNCRNSGPSIYTLQGKITEALHSWEEAGVHAKNRNNWRIVPTAIWWTIWKERNLRVFDNTEHTYNKSK